MRLGPQKLAAFFYHLPNFFRLFWRLFKDPRVGMGPKLLMVALLGYLVLPVDLLPDVLPALGYMDDLLLIFFGLKGFIWLCPRDVVQEHVRRIARQA